MMQERVAVVTGANKGIGLSIATGLLERWSGVVYVTARDAGRGQAAVAALPLALRARARFHQLDVARASSVQAFAQHLQEQHGHLDILVNNAAVAYLGDTTLEQDEETVAINYGSLSLMETFVFPLLRAEGRVLNVSSDCGHVSNLRNLHWIQRLVSADLRAHHVDAFVQWFLEGRRDGTFRANVELVDGGVAAAYRISKVGVCARTRVQAAMMRARRVAVNSVHPGLVRTDMTRGVGFYTTTQAAETPLKLLLETPQSVTAQYFWFDGRQLDWTDHNADYWFKSTTLQPSSSQHSTQMSS